MAHTLISFLGRAAKNYNSANYDFGNQKISQSSFFGIPLADHLKPDCLVILGTTGSMWDVLLYSLDLDEELIDHLDQIGDACRSDQTTSEQLLSLESAVSQCLGIKVLLRLIPYGRNVLEQHQILSLMASFIANGDTVSLDVTHGLRHLPMLAQTNALYLKGTKNVTVGGIYYGAWELRQEEITPVMDLKGLLDIADWTNAVHALDQNGDYSVVAELLHCESPEAASLLREAAFYERTLRTGQARSKLKELSNLLEKLSFTGASKLFVPIMQNRLSWIKEERLHLRQKSLAISYLENADFVRATIMGFESFITYLMYKNNISNPDNYSFREEVRKSYESKKDDARFEVYKKLRNMRNCLAHGSAPVDFETQQALSSEDKLSKELHWVFGLLLDFD